MIDREDIEKISKTRLEDAQTLLKGNRFDGAVYLCGYAVELGLKARICQTLKWVNYPENSDYKSFKTHDLDVLLHLSGIEAEVKGTLLAEWSVVARWNPEDRYKPVGKVTESDAEEMVRSARTLLETV